MCSSDLLTAPLADIDGQTVPKLPLHKGIGKPGAVQSPAAGHKDSSDHHAANHFSANGQLSRCGSATEAIRRILIFLQHGCTRLSQGLAPRYGQGIGQHKPTWLKKLL